MTAAAKLIDAAAEAAGVLQGCAKIFRDDDTPGTAAMVQRAYQSLMDAMLDAAMEQHAQDERKRLTL